MIALGRQTSAGPNASYFGSWWFTSSSAAASEAYALGYPSRNINDLVLLRAPLAAGTEFRTIDPLYVPDVVATLRAETKRVRVLSGAVPMEWIDVAAWVRARPLPWGYKRASALRFVVADGEAQVTDTDGLSHGGSAWLFNARVSAAAYARDLRTSLAYLDHCDLAVGTGAGSGNGHLIAHSTIRGTLGPNDSLLYLRDCDLDLRARDATLDVLGDCRIGGAYDGCTFGMVTGGAFAHGTRVVGCKCDNLIRVDLGAGDWLGTTVDMLIRPHLHVGSLRGASLEGTTLISERRAEVVDAAFAAHVTAGRGVLAKLRHGHQDDEIIDTWEVVSDPEPAWIASRAAWEYTLTRTRIRARYRDQLRAMLAKRRARETP